MVCWFLNHYKYTKSPVMSSSWLCVHLHGGTLFEIILNKIYMADSKNISFWSKENYIFCIIFLYFFSHTMETRTHKKNLLTLESRHKPSGVTYRAPRESFGSKNGKMAFEACYWLALKMIWGNKRADRIKLSDVLKHIYWTTNPSSELFFPTSI